MSKKNGNRLIVQLYCIDYGLMGQCRRLLYVACTRAQGLLYLSHAANRRVGGETKSKGLSEFVSVIVKHNQVGATCHSHVTCDTEISQTLFTTRLPELSVGDRAVLARVLDKPTPDESEVQRRLAELCDILQHFR